MTLLACPVCDRTVETCATHPEATCRAWPARTLPDGSHVPARPHRLAAMRPVAPERSLCAPQRADPLPLAYQGADRDEIRDETPQEANQ